MGCGDQREHVREREEGAGEGEGKGRQEERQSNKYSNLIWGGENFIKQKV